VLQKTISPKQTRSKGTARPTAATRSQKKSPESGIASTKGTIRKKGPVRAKRTSHPKKKKQKNSSVWGKTIYVFLLSCVILVGATIFQAYYNPYWFIHLNGVKAYNVYLPGDEFAFNGLDISRYQGDIDWTKLREMKTGEFPLTFLFFKATEGQDYIDGYYTQNMDSARKEGYICGSYHFFRSNKTGIEQAENFIQNCRLKRGDLAPILDIEESPRGSVEAFRTEIQACLDRLEKRYGCKPIIYANVSFKKQYLDTEAFNAYPLWIAHYYVAEPKGDLDWCFWQFTDLGRVPGIRGYVDMNVMRGSFDQLNAMRIH